MKFLMMRWKGQPLYPVGCPFLLWRVTEVSKGVYSIHTARQGCQSLQNFTQAHSPELASYQLPEVLSSLWADVCEELHLYPARWYAADGHICGAGILSSQCW